MYGNATGHKIFVNDHLILGKLARSTKKRELLGGPQGERKVQKDSKGDCGQEQGSKK